MRLRRHAAGLLCLLCLLALPLAAADSDTPAKPKTPIAQSPGVAAALQVFDHRAITLPSVHTYQHLDPALKRLREHQAQRL